MGEEIEDRIKGIGAYTDAEMLAGIDAESGSSPASSEIVGAPQLECVACHEMVRSDRVDSALNLCPECWDIGCKEGLIGGTLGAPVLAPAGIEKIALIVAEGGA